MKIKQIIVLCAVLFFCGIAVVDAASLIGSNNCVIGGNSSDNSKIVTVNTTGSECYSICNTYCAKKFKIDVGAFAGEDIQTTNSTVSKDLNAIKNSVIAANKDRIENCLQNCYSGTQTSTNIRIPIQFTNSGSPINDYGNKPEPWACDVMVGPDVKNALNFTCVNSNNTQNDSDSLCSNSQLSRGYVDGDVVVLPDTSISISIANYNPSSVTDANELFDIQGNNVYLCGFKTVMIAPDYNFKNKIFNGSTIIRSSISDSQPVKTGLFVKDGDLLSINYFGKYCSNIYRDVNQNYVCKLNNEDYRLGVQIGGKSIQFETLGRQINDQSDDIRKQYSSKCSVCMTNAKDPICASQYCSTIQPQTVTNGLNTYINWINSPSLLTKQLYNDDSESNFRSTIVSGHLEGVTSVPQEVQISYNPSNFNRAGGYFVNLEWKGCHFKDGERLEYTLLNSAVLNSKKFVQYITQYAQWKDLKFVNENGVTRSLVKVTKSDLALPTYLGINEDGNVISSNDVNSPRGKIFLRVKTLSPAEANSMGVVNYSRADTIGQYYLKIQTEEPSGFLNNFVEHFEDALNGTVERVFSVFRSNQIFVNIVRAILILYVAVMGMFFVAGISPISQKDGVIIVFKIAIVVILIGNDSLEFFKTYFFDAFAFDDMKRFANLFTPEININIGQSTDDCFGDDSQIKLLCVLQQDLNYFFSWSFWNRMMGMFMSGFLLATIAIVAGVIMYVIVILKVTFLYCVAMLSLTVTLALAPIFFPMVLFKYTKNLFDTWVKQLVAFMLQPIFIFTAIALLRLMFLTLIQSVMGNSMCKICWLDVGLPFGNYCLFNSYFYVPLSLGSSPGSYSLPMTNIGLLVALFFIGYAISSFCEFASSMARRLINFSAFDIASTGGPEKMYQDFKSAGSVVYNAATLPLDVLAIDDTSRKIRRDNREAQYAANKNKDKNAKP